MRRCVLGPGCPQVASSGARLLGCSAADVADVRGCCCQACADRNARRQEDGRLEFAVQPLGSRPWSAAQAAGSCLHGAMLARMQAHPGGWPAGAGGGAGRPGRPAWHPAGTAPAQRAAARDGCASGGAAPAAGLRERCCQQQPLGWGSLPQQAWATQRSLRSVRQHRRRHLCQPARVRAAPARLARQLVARPSARAAAEPAQPRRQSQAGSGAGRGCPQRCRCPQGLARPPAPPLQAC